MGVTIGLTLVLGLVLVREVVVRIRVERALGKATSTLKELTGTGDESERPLPDQLDVLAERLCMLLRAAWAVVALTDAEGALRVVSTCGSAPMSVGDEVDGRTIPKDRTRHLLAVPLALGGGQLGVVEVGSQPGVRFSRTDHELSRILADHLSSTVERARLVDAERRSRLGSTHARAQLNLLAEVSIVLARALDDPRPSLVETAE